MTVYRLVRSGHLRPEPWPLSDHYGVVFEINKLKAEFAKYYANHYYYFRKSSIKIREEFENDSKNRDSK